MPKKPSAKPVKKPVAKKAAHKTVAVKTVAGKTVKKAVAGTAATKKPAAAKPVNEKRPRAKVIKEHPANLVIDARDPAAAAAIADATEKAMAPARVRNRRSAVDRLEDPPAEAEPGSSLVDRVGQAIERELSKIERIMSERQIPVVQRVETESRARVLASLARTLKEVMRLREQERGADDTKAADDDDAVPRDLDEFRRELSRRLEGLVARAAPLPAGGDEPG